MRSHGEHHHTAKLTSHDVRLILQLHPEVSTRQIAVKFNVSQSAIAAILSGRSWRHV